MYFVHYRTVIGYNLCKFHTLEEAKELVQELTRKGIFDVHVSQEIPTKIKVEVEI